MSIHRPQKQKQPEPAPDGIGADLLAIEPGSNHSAGANNGSATPGVPSHRSSEELSMREHVVAWGRARWPDARVYHELDVGDCRIDLAFIRPADLIGFEIKSSKDSLDRLEKQMRVYGQHLPEVWLAVAPKWERTPSVYLSNTLVVDAAAGVQRPSYGFPPGQRRHYVWPAMLCLLLSPEVRAVARRRGFAYPSRTPAYKVRQDLALRMTGESIRDEVCRELRARRTNWPADPPVTAPRGRTVS